MTVAVVPVAFYTQEHLGLTRSFLVNLIPEVSTVRVYHNGGPLGVEGMLTLIDLPVHIHPCPDWSFFKMWNDGIYSAGDDIALVLNNDIYWTPGELRRLAQELDESDSDVATASVDPEARLRWCFAIRPWLAPRIFEGYKTWYGDNELENLIDRDGFRRIHVPADVSHPRVQSTTDHIPGIAEMREADRVLFEKRWG